MNQDYKESPLLDVNGVTLQYKTIEHLITATYKVSFQVFSGDRLCCWGRRAAASQRF